MFRNYCLVFIGLMSGLGFNCYADSSDSEQPIQIYADKFDGDDVKQIAIYTGNVAVHQGTLELHGNKLTLTIDPQGFRHGVMTPLAGELVRFKQRRDPKTPGIEEWMHGEGEQLTYNEKTNQLILTKRAKVSRLENGKLMDKSAGERITYNLTDSTAQMDGDKSKGTSGRVSTVIAPRNDKPAPQTQKNEAVQLQSPRGIQK
jgi:lipopolysaccharide export system protein LptA